jgi:hypothetical protein
MSTTVVMGDGRCRVCPLVVGGPGGRHDAPARRGSAARQTDVRGLGPQVGGSQEGALTSHAPGTTWWQRTAGDRPCSGGAPARHGGHDHHSADHCGDRLRPGMLSNHLGPQQAGQLASDRDDHQLLGVLGSLQATEPAAQPQLGGPGPGDRLGWQALLAAAQFQGRLGSVLVGPGGLDQLGAQVGVATLGDAASPGGVAAGVFARDQAAAGP